MKLSPPDCPHRHADESGFCHDCSSRPFKPSDAGLPVNLIEENQRLREENAWLRMQLSVEGKGEKQIRRPYKQRVTRKPAGKCVHGSTNDCKKCAEARV
jgi:hypothetical protein